ncbi:MAG: hypothetical protein GY838_02800 [bacterium]|nr:hypothetical protein [bacterium]
MPYPRHASALGLLIAFLAIPALAEPTRVDNDASPRDGIRTVELEQLWTVGDEDSDLILGVVNRVLIDQESNVYLLDGQLAQVHVISPEGELLRTIGREGDGPGEFRQPTDMVFLPDGTLGVMQAVPGKIIKIDRNDGTPAGNWTLRADASGAMLQMQVVRHAGGNVVVGGVHQIVDTTVGTVTRKSFLARVDETTGLITTEYADRQVVIQLATIRLDENELAGGFEGRFDVDPDGRVVVVVPRNGYEVSVFDPDGTHALTFTREYESWQRDDQALGIWQRILETVQRNQVPGAPLSWETTEPDIQSLHAAPDGSVWIQTAHGRWAPPAGVFTCYDVFAPDGTYAEEVRFVCDGNPRSDMLFFSGSEYVFRISGFWDAALARFGGAGSTVAEGEEPEPVTVTCYRVSS